MMNVPKCPRCGEKYVTSKARFFFKKEGLEGEPVCLYCLSEITGKTVGSTGMLGGEPTPSPAVSKSQINNSVQGCRPCAQRRRMLN